MGQPKYNPPTKDWTSWLNEEPEFIDYNLDGSEFIPILFLEKQLTELDSHWGTENFKFRTFSVLDKIYISSSVELVISYNGKQRRLVGASTFQFKTADGIEEMPSTLESAEPSSLSESLKNAAKKLGNRFGSQLNDRGGDVIRNNGKKSNRPVRDPKNSVKMDADEKIMEMYNNAVKDNNTAIVIMLETRYNINKSYFDA